MLNENTFNLSNTIILRWLGLADRAKCNALRVEILVGGGTLTNGKFSMNQNAREGRQRKSFLSWALAQQKN